MVGSDRGSTKLILNVEERGICGVWLVKDLGLDVLDGVEYFQAVVNGWVDDVNEWHFEGITCQTI